MSNSVDWLFHKLWETPKDKLNWHSILQQAKEMHKEEIEDAYDDGSYDEYEYHINNYPRKISEDYYNEKFGGNNEPK